jgi:hypothetical protein
MPVSQAVQIKDTNYLLLHGSNDQDVSSMMGEKQYNNLYFTGDSDEQYIKSSVYILGANHGQFNSLWGRYDGEGAMNGYLNTCNFIDEAEQKLIAKAFIKKNGRTSSIINVDISDDTGRAVAQFIGVGFKLDSK